MDGSEGTSADVVARIIDAAAISPEAQSLFPQAV